MVWQAALSLLSNFGGSQVGQAASSATGPVQRAIGYATENAMPNVLPGADLVFKMMAQRRIPYARAIELLKAQGIVGPHSWHEGQPIPAAAGDSLAHMWEQAWQSTLTVPSPGETIELLNRQWIDTTVARRWLLQTGMHDVDARNGLLRLRYQQPGPSDLIMFALKEGWDQQVVNRFQYDAEFPPAFQHWMTQQGYGTEDPRPPSIRGQSPWVPWAQMYWRVHWANIAPGQAYEMYQRLRPGRVNRFQVNGLNPREFTLDDLRTVLKVNDYPVPYRDQLAALATRTPRLVDLDHFYQLRQVTREELVELHKDLGYLPADAETRTGYIVAADEVRRRKQLLGNVQGRILEAYRIGLLSRDDAAVQLYEQHWIGTPQAATYANWEPGVKRSVALADTGITGALDRVDYEVRIATLKEVIADVKRRYARGMLRYEGARQFLQDAGLTEDKAVAYLTRWQIQHRGPRAASTVAKIIDWYRHGIIPRDYAAQLVNELGYNDGRTDWILARADQQRGSDLAAVMVKSAKDQQARQKALEAQVAAQAKEQKQTIAELTRQASASALKRYYVKGLIGDAQLTNALAARGFSPESVALQLADAKVDRADYLAKKAAAAAKAAGGK